MAAESGGAQPVVRWKFLGWFLLGLATFTLLGVLILTLTETPGRPEQTAQMIRVVAFPIIIGAWGVAKLATRRRR